MPENEIQEEAKIPVIVVEVSGGVVRSVYSDSIKEAKVIIRDCDNIEEGDPDPIEQDVLSGYFEIY